MLKQELASLQGKVAQLAVREKDVERRAEQQLQALKRQVEVRRMNSDWHLN